VSRRRVALAGPRPRAVAHPRARDDGLDASGFRWADDPAGMALLAVVMAFLLIASRRLNGGRLLPI
jgi:hypothetical protein